MNVLAAADRFCKYEGFQRVIKLKFKSCFMLALMAGFFLQACSDTTDEGRTAREAFEDSADRVRDAVDEVGDKAEESTEELRRAARDTAETVAEKTERAAEDVGEAARATLDTTRRKARELLDERRESRAGEPVEE